MPHFFKYAKGYAPTQVEKLNNTFVNKLHKYIKDKRLSFKNFSDFDYHNLMSDPYISIDDHVLEIYGELNRSYHFKIGRDDGSHNNIPYIKLNVKEELSRLGYSDMELSDMLVAFLYGSGSEYKNLLWLCYGDIILENIKRNVDTSLAVCMKCGKRFQQRGPHHKYCDHCFLEKIKGEDQRIKTCKDCGEEFLVHRSIRNKPRCDKCQIKSRRESVKMNVRHFRHKDAM